MISWYKNTAIWIGTSEKPLSFDSETITTDTVELLTALNVKKLGFLSQVHGNDIVELSFEDLDTQMSEKVTNFGKADGIIIRNVPPLSDRDNSKAVGIRTADCLPVILQTKNDVALLHAGWRSLAANIIEKAIDKLKIDSNTKCNAWIGPAAKECCYEVGAEVLNALKIKSECGGQKQQKIDLQEQAAARIHSLTNFVDLEIDRHCSICSPNLHSFRENNTKLRNLSFVVL